MTFKPLKPGEYPCTLLLHNIADIRCIKIRGIAIPATKELSLMRPGIRQDIQNTSDETWNFKITLSGDSSFSTPARFSLKPNSEGALQISFTGTRVGTFTAELTIFNQTKESTLIYKLSAVVDEPPAEGKIVMDCQARQNVLKTIDIKPCIKNGELVVTTTVPLIEFEKTIRIVNGALEHPFSFTLNSPRSGILAGIITFTDPLTKVYNWYVLEIHVDLPAPESILTISTVARKSASVQIPISNTKPFPVTYSVTIADNDVFGEKKFTVEAGETSNYIVVITPLKSGKRTSSVSFYSNDESEFWYSLRIEVDEPPIQILAPVTAPIGKFASTFIILENSSKSNSTYRIENDSPAAWQVMAKRVVQLSPGEKRKIEIRYLPTGVGLKEIATIAFKSQENGDYVYRVTGTGKPPQPLSPTLVTSPIEQTKTAVILFTNPFPYPSHFSISINNEQEGDVCSISFETKSIFTDVVRRRISDSICFFADRDWPISIVNNYFITWSCSWTVT
jgi:hypothetical protein